MTSSQQSLLVPINVAALRVSLQDLSSGITFGKITADFQNLATKPYIGASIRPQPFDEEPTPPGIHLHWALPDALTRSDPSNPQGLRRAPDRFLVVRLAIAEPPVAFEKKAWVVESDYQWSPGERSAREGDARNALSRAVPLEYPGEPQRALVDPLFAYQGRVRPLSRAWKDSESEQRPRLPVTAFGYGTEAYAAAYPHCRNVFGFFDPLLDRVTAPDGLDAKRGYLGAKHRYLSYLVIGWYSDLRSDPITLVGENARKRAAARLKQVGPQAGNGEAFFDEALADEIKKEYRWSYKWSTDPGGLPGQSSHRRTRRPVRTFFVGQVTALEWSGDRPSSTVNTDSVVVALGTTTAGALSALLASTQAPDHAVAVETLLNDIQFDLLHEYATASGQTNLPDALHRRAFAPVAAGHGSATESGRIWVVKRTDSPEGRGREPGQGDGLTDVARDLGAPLPEDIGRGLNALNLTQAACDELAAAVATRRGQVFADWTTYLAAKNDDARDYIGKEIDALDLLVRDLATKAGARDAAKADLAALLRLPKYAKTSRSGSVPVYELEWVTAPRFYQPSDPVILLSGVTPSTRYGGDGRLDPDKAGNLICRASEELTRIGELRHLDPGTRTRLVTAAARAEWDSIFPTELPRREDLIDLCVEACLLNPWLGKFIASSDLTRYQQDYMGGKTEDFLGVAPSRVGVTETHPWIPLILQWEAAFNPFQPLSGQNEAPAAYPEMWGLRYLELQASNPEITYTGANPGFPDAGPTTYRGSVTLTHNVHIALTGQIETYLKTHPLDPERDSLAMQDMKRTLATVSHLPFRMMGQALEGFHRQLLTRDQTLQMRVFDPPAGREGDWKIQYLPAFQFAFKVSRAAVKERDAASLEDRGHYHPIRGGLLKITRLRILDAFGQVRDVIAPNRSGGVLRPDDVVLSADLKAPTEWKEKAALLPVRIAQPARLSFRYRSAGSGASELLGGPAPATALEMNSDPASSPVFGWVLYNRFDDALAIYDEEGRPIGSFNLHGAPWQEAPGPNRGVANPHLREFVQHLGGQVPTNARDPNYAAEVEKFRQFLDKLLATIDHGATGIEPDDYKQDQGLAVLIGRPLALVLADLRLDLYGSVSSDGALPGLPAIDQSREAFRDAVARFKSAGSIGYVEKDRRSADFARVRFPVRLGDDAKAHDGLVGYFVKGQDAATTYRTFYAPGAASGGNANVVPPPLTGTERLSLAAADRLPATVMMLVDPRAPVHATTGILPVKSIALPPVQFADALKRIDATFLVAPVLGGADRVALPVPPEVGHAWSWLTRHADQELFDTKGVGIRTWVTQNLVDPPNTRAAFSVPPLQLSEGWLHLYPVDTSSDGADNTKPATPPTPYAIRVKPDANGDLILAPATATLHGDGIAMAETDAGQRFIGYWSAETDYVSWKVTAHGGYHAAIDYSAPEDSQFDLQVLDAAGHILWTQHYRAPRTGDWGRIQRPQVVSWRPGEYEWIYAVPLAWFGLDRGEYEVRIKPAQPWKAINVWSVALSKLVEQSGPVISLLEWDATLHGAKIRHTAIPGALRPENTYIGGWTDPKEYVTWRTKLAAGTWNVDLVKRSIGLSDADYADSQVTVEVRRAESAQVVTSRRAALPRGQHRVHVVDLVTERTGEYEIGVKPLQEIGRPWRAINLDRVELDSTLVVKQMDGKLTLSANNARVFPSGTAPIAIVLGHDGQPIIQYGATREASAAFAYWTATFTDVQSGDIGVEITYATLDADARIAIEIHHVNEESVLSRVGYSCVASGGLTTFRTLSSIWPNPTVRVASPGSYQIRVRTDDPGGGKAINIRSIALIVPEAMALC